MSAFVTQEAIEVVYSPQATGRLTQIAVEVVYKPAASARLTQLAIEVVIGERIDNKRRIAQFI